MGEASGPRQIASGLRKHYPEAQQLQGRRVVVVTNLKPRALVGFESNGMVLAGWNADKTRCELVDVPAGAPAGERIGCPKYPFSDAEPVKQMSSSQVKRVWLKGVSKGLTCDADVALRGLPADDERRRVHWPIVRGGTRLTDLSGADPEAGAAHARVGGEERARAGERTRARRKRPSRTGTRRAVKTAGQDGGWEERVGAGRRRKRAGGRGESNIEVGHRTRWIGCGCATTYLRQRFSCGAIDVLPSESRAAPRRLPPRPRRRRPRRRRPRPPFTQTSNPPMPNACGRPQPTFRRTRKVAARRRPAIGAQDAKKRRAASEMIRINPTWPCRPARRCGGPCRPTPPPSSPRSLRGQEARSSSLWPAPSSAS